MTPTGTQGFGTTADVVVVGCGAGGGVIAKELGEAGLSVVVLEAGRRYDPEADYPTDQLEFEAKIPHIFAPPNTRRDRYTSSGRFTYSRVKGVGGSTLHYQAVSPRMHESDFRVRTLDGVADDWPITYAELEPYYTRVEWELGVAGPSGEDANLFEPPRSQRYPTPAHPLDLTNLAIKRGADRLGLHLVEVPVAIPTKNWMGRPACLSAGTCDFGCRARAKSSIDVTYVPKAEATGRIEIRTLAMAREVTVAPDGRARGVVYIDADGEERYVAARAVVLAGNAVETPRLLLMSTSSAFPHGLANSSGLVGRNFTEHLAVFAKGAFDERLDPWRGMPVKGLIQDFYETSAGNDFARGWSLLTESGGAWPLTTARRAGGWGAGHKARMLDSFAHTVGMSSVGEQLPHPENSVRLDPFQKDSFGLPVPFLTNRQRGNDVAMIRRISEELKQILDAAGAREVVVDPSVPGMSAHYLGTCRMGQDPGSSVVDRWCKAHDVPNLFIGDGSVFVTAGAVNPALTISALATRTAGGIIEKFDAGEL